MKLKNNIANILEEKKISIKKLSEVIEMSYSPTHDLVTRDDLSDTRLGTLQKVADYLEVGIDEIYTKEEENMKDLLVLQVLQKLDSVDLLNSVGVAIARNPQRFKITLENMEEYFQGDTEEEISKHIAGSSLVGGDDELAIQEWVAEEEREYMEKETGLN